MKLYIKIQDDFGILNKSYQLVFKKKKKKKKKKEKNTVVLLKILKSFLLLSNKLSTLFWDKIINFMQRKERIHSQKNGHTKIEQEKKNKAGKIATGIFSNREQHLLVSSNKCGQQS